MILGTHNSATGGQLQWWLRPPPLAWLINSTSKCQGRTISEQLGDGASAISEYYRPVTTDELAEWEYKKKQVEDDLA